MPIWLKSHEKILIIIKALLRRHLNQWSDSWLIDYTTKAELSLQRQSKDSLDVVSKYLIPDGKRRIGTKGIMRNNRNQLEGLWTCPH